MSTTIRNTFPILNGDWTFTVSLGGRGSSDAAISMVQEAEEKISGSYSGKLGNTPITGTYEGNNFEFTFTSERLGTDITYRGELISDGTVKGSVIIRDKAVGTYTGTKK